MSPGNVRSTDQPGAVIEAAQGEWIIRKIHGMDGKASAFRTNALATGPAEVRDGGDPSSYKSGSDASEDDRVRRHDFARLLYQWEVILRCGLTKESRRRNIYHFRDAMLA